MMNIDHLTTSERLMDVLTPRVTGHQSMITPIKVHVEHHMNKIEEKHRLAQRTQQSFYSPLIRPCW